MEALDSDEDEYDGSPTWAREHYFWLAQRSPTNHLGALSASRAVGERWVSAG